MKPFSQSSLLLLACALAWGCGSDAPQSTSKGAGPQPAAQATYVGREVCAGCHAQQNELWRGSHHDLAMQEVTEETVLGDFDDTSFSYAGVTSTFSRRDGSYFVRTDGPDGELTDYEIAYVFGVHPLQQYLIAFPGGRYQALGIVWDARPETEGGQRWVHLYADDEVDHEDPLHWTKIYQNWNQQCAECHSTELIKGYDAETQTYDTTWSEIDVSCEACHGAGSAHADWAERVASGDVSGDAAAGLAVDLKDRSGGVWEINADNGIAERSAPRSSWAELEMCGRCHARRSPIKGDYEHGRPFLDSYRLSLLDEGLYHADGHILDEVYVYGSFLQSKMHGAGVTCTDCHDPHRLEIASPNDACARCHLSQTFATPEHHFHESASAGASCVECHMPSRVYMAVDSRRDHGFRIPRPDLSVEIGTPNACNDCHSDRTPEWAAQAFAEWYGDVEARRSGFARALDAARRGLPSAGQQVATLATDSQMPAIARATAFSMARSRPRQADLTALRAGLADSEPLVRLGAVSGVEAADPRIWPELLATILDDPVRAVRIEAGRVLSQLPKEAIPEALAPSLEAALAEYVEAQEFNADRPEGQVNLGLVYGRQGRAAEAERAYRTALELDPWFGPAAVNLADLYRATGRDDEGEAVLRQALERMPEDAGLHHALGLTLVRLGQMTEALEELGRASEQAPEQARYAYTYGVALHSGGATSRALQVLSAAHERHPGDPDLLTALATLHRDGGSRAQALAYARKLLVLRPNDSGIQQLVAELSGG